MGVLCSLARLSLKASFVAFISWSGAVAEQTNLECREGLLFYLDTGKPVIDPTTQTQRRCGAERQGWLDDPAVVAGGAVAVLGGTLGGLAASGAFKSNNAQAPIGPLPLSTQ